MNRAAESEVLPVAVFLERIQEVLDAGIATVWVEGEVFEYTGPHRSSGHVYFKLRDGRAVLNVILWRSQVQRALLCPLEEGRRVRARGRLNLYPPQGRLSLILERVEDVGAGDLARRLEELRRRLREEGLFEAARKRPLPVRPRRVALLTARGSAAEADVLRTLQERRAPFEVIRVPVQVQGEGAVPDLVRGLHRAQRLGADVVLLTRGGGSLEDLWAFQEEAVVRAVADSRLPVLVAVGHETDTSLADLAADESARTPTAAAVRLCEGWQAARGRVEDLAAGLEAGARGWLEARRERIEGYRRELRHLRPDRRLLRLEGRLQQSGGLLAAAASRRLAEARRCLERSGRRLAAAPGPWRGLETALQQSGRRLAVVPGPWRRLRRRLERAGRRLLASGPGPRMARLDGRTEGLAGRLRAASPLAPLERGFALVEHPGRPGAWLREARELQPGQEVRVRLHRGAFRGRVEEVEPEEA